MPDEKKPRSRAWDRSQKGADYRNAYGKDHYERIEILVPIGTKDRIKAYADRNGLTVTQYIMRLIHDKEGTE